MLDSLTVFDARKYACERAIREQDVMYVYRKADKHGLAVYYVRNESEGKPEDSECVWMVGATGSEVEA